DWNSIRASRPETVPADAWDAILVNFRRALGAQAPHSPESPPLPASDFWADYVAEMAENANYLGTVGQATSDLGALWGFEVAQASAALNPVRYLAGSVDAAAPAP